MTLACVSTVLKPSMTRMSITPSFSAAWWIDSFSSMNSAVVFSCSIPVATLPASLCLLVSFPGVSRSMSSAVCFRVPTRCPRVDNSFTSASTTIVLPLFLNPVTETVMGGMDVNGAWRDLSLPYPLN